MGIDVRTVHLHPAIRLWVSLVAFSLLHGYHNSNRDTDLGGRV